MIIQSQHERVSYEFWRNVRKQLADWNLTDPDSAIQKYVNFLRDKEIPWDLVFHQGVNAAAKSILDAEKRPV
ncbi:MAG TPA: hypothetical protein VG326_06900 [Tepidisphaeraceae bacterium]|jgi:hypothetical protein|nr:hypothetical protein [Tepidisphaeraceae bacterium]